MKGRYLTEYEGITYDYAPNDYVQLVIYRHGNEFHSICGSVAPASVGRLIDECVRPVFTKEQLNSVDEMRGWVIQHMPHSMYATIRSSAIATTNEDK